MTDPASYRPLSDREREALRLMLDSRDAMRRAFMALHKLGWRPPEESVHGALDDFDDGYEVVRALVTDTHSLVKMDGWEARWEDWQEEKRRRSAVKR